MLVFSNLGMVCGSYEKHHVSSLVIMCHTGMWDHPPQIKWDPDKFPVFLCTVLLWQDSEPHTVQIFSLSDPYWGLHGSFHVICALLWQSEYDLCVQYIVIHLSFTMYVLLLDDYSMCHPSATPVPSETDDATQILCSCQSFHQNTLDTANLIFIKWIFPFALLWLYLIC